VTNDKDIVRYEINEHGELSLSYGRYVRYDDYEDAVRELRKEIERLEDEILYLEDDSSVFHVNLGDEDCRPYSLDDD
jgi:hypothetical protein